MIEQTRFLIAVFLCTEFKLENIYSGVNFFGKNVCGNFYMFAGTYFCGSLKKLAKIRTRKHFVPQSVVPHDGTMGMQCEYYSSGGIYSNDCTCGIDN